MNLRPDPKYLEPERDPYKPEIIFKWKVPRRNWKTSECIRKGGT